MPERDVSFPPGETIYTEFFYRQQMRDGTIVDTPPRMAAPDLAGAFQNVAAMFGGKRMERTVTVTAGEWREVAGGEAQ